MQFFHQFRETWVFHMDDRAAPAAPQKKNIGHESNRNIRDTRLDSRGVAAVFISARGGKYFGEESWQRPGNTLHTFSKANVRKTLQKLSKRHPSHRHISQGNAKVWAPKIAKEKQIAGPWTTFILLQDAVVPSGNHYFHQQKQSMRLGTSL